MKPEEDIFRCFRAIYNPNENERHNAADAMYNTLQRINVHPSDIHLTIKTTLVQDNFRAIEHLEQQLQRLANENNFYRQQFRVVPGGEKILAQAQKAGYVTNRWPEMEELIISKLGGLKGKGILQKIFNINERTLDRWREGQEQIPDNYFTILAKMSNSSVEEPNSLPIVETASGRKPPEPPFDWSPEKFKEAANLFLNGRMNEIPMKVGCNSNQVAQLIHNSAPKFPFDVDAPESDAPMTWGEMWQIGGTIYRNDKKPDGSRERAWLPKTLANLGLDTDLKPPHPINASSTRIKEFRQQYRDHQSNRNPSKGSHRKLVGDAVMKAGHKGITMNEYAAENGLNDNQKRNYLRPNDFATFIFSIGSQPGRDGEIWVSNDFKDLYPEEFATWEIRRKV